MFGYRVFRANDYFPVNWLRVRNSLHSMKKTEDRFSPSRIRQIKKGLKNGAKVEEAHTVEEIHDFSRMLHKVYSSRIRRYFPANDFFRHMEFMDVGLPFRKHGYRDFVLRFGGKQSSTRRWFRVNWNWLNKLLVKFYV